VVPSRELKPRRLLFPITERAFTYDRYERLLDELADASRFRVVPLREFAATVDRARAVVGLRHDVDERLDRAIDFAALEATRGLNATYFVLETAGYWRRPGLVEKLLGIQELGHEIGWHNDLVTTECVLGRDARALLAAELERLRSAGLSIDGVAAHGAPSCYRYRYHNGYFFFPDELVTELPNAETVDGPLGRRRVPRGTLAEFDLAYDAYHLDNTTYFSDASFDSEGRRWHTDDLDLDVLEPGARTIILTHPDHWDRSMISKLGRYVSKVRAAIGGDD
jgi:hypothetical protein